MEKVVIILPIHKLFQQLTQNELHSLKQLNGVLSNFPLCLIAAENFSLEGYMYFFNRENVLIEQFKEEYFKTIRSYNSLCLSKEFYERFLSFECMLIYQFDAYVFRNDLEFWTRQGYDYIGAPFHKDNNEPFNAELWTVGNGGFSLRSSYKCHKLLSTIECYYSVVKLIEKLRCKRFITKAFIKLGLFNFIIVENIKLNKYNEDYVFGVLSKQINKNFSVAPLDVAWQFSFEAHPALLYKLNGNQLPFGCHGWEKYEPEFWRNFINASSTSEVLEK